MKNLNNKEPILPKYLTKIVNVLPIGKDYGKGNNIVPLLFKEKECSTTIIGIDKNVIYGKDFLEIILDENENNPNSIILDHNKNAISLKPKHYGCEILKRDTENYNIEWFINNTNNHKIINYNENYYY
jgi:choline kinase